MENGLASGGGAGKIPNSFHHHHCRHHHFFYISPHCPLHRPISQPENHSPSCNFSTSYPFHSDPEPVASPQPGPNSRLVVSQEFDDPSVMIQDETEIVEADEEEEPIFVLTDEWRDFFAKSEAKRRLAKKEAKKGKN